MARAQRADASEGAPMGAVVGAATDAAMNSSNTQQPREDLGEDRSELQPARAAAKVEFSTWAFVKWSAISLVCVVALGVAVARVLHELGIE